MKPLKIALIVMATVLGLALAAIAWVVATFDAARIKSEITTLVKEQKQRTLTIDGDLSLSFFPSIGVRVGKLSLSERNSERRFASVESARVSVRLMPLLAKEIVVDQVEVMGLDAALVRRVDGSLNIDDLLSKEKKGEKSPAPKFDVSGIKLANSALTFSDLKAGQTLSLTDLNLATGQLANAADGRLEFSGRFTRQAPQAPSKQAADLQLTGHYRYDLEHQHYAVEKMEAKVRGDFAGVHGLDLRLAATSLELAAGKGELKIDGLTLSAKGRAGEDSLDLRLEAPKLAFVGNQASGAAIKLQAKLAGKQKQIDASLDLSSVEGSSAALKIASLSLGIDARRGGTTLKGGLKSPLSADLTAQTVDLPGFAGTFDLAHPAMPMKQVKLPLTGSLHADLAKGHATLDLATRFDESMIEAKLQATRFAPLALAFDLAIDRLDIDKYFPPKPMESGGKGAPAPEAPLDLAALQGLDLNGSVRIGSLQVQHLKLANVKLETRAQNGRLDVAPLVANLYQGSVAGSLALQAQGNRIALKQTLSGVAINPLMKDVLNKDLIEGRGNVALDLVTAGATVTAMKKALAGSASLSLRDGAIKGINLAKSFREAKARIGGGQDAVQQASKTDKTDFSELSASFRIAHGVARNEDLVAKSPFLRLAGAGDIDIGNGSMNYLAKATLVNTSAGQEGKELAHMQGLTVPVRLSGPFDALAWKLEFGSLIADAAKQKLQEKVQEKVQEQAQGKLGEKLKGLFGK